MIHQRCKEGAQTFGVSQRYGVYCSKYIGSKTCGKEGASCLHRFTFYQPLSGMGCKGACTLNLQFESTLHSGVGEALGALPPFHVHLHTLFAVQNNTATCLFVIHPCTPILPPHFIVVCSHHYANLRLVKR